MEMTGSRTKAGRADASKDCPSGWGKYSRIFWKFYDTGDKKARIDFGSSKEAWDASKSVYRCMDRKGIYDVSVRRRRNVLYLERTEVGKC